MWGRKYEGKRRVRLYGANSRIILKWILRKNNENL
jgi:hypothetical protein